MGNEDLIEFGRPPASRRRRLALLVAAGLAVAAIVVVRQWPDPAPEPATSAPTSPPAPARPGAWPTAPAACGWDTELPIVAPTEAPDHTGIGVLLAGPTAASAGTSASAGSGLYTVDFDTGRATALPGITLGPEEFVSLLPGSVRIGVAYGCTTPGPLRLVDVDVDRAAWFAPLPRPLDAVLADGTRAWGVRWPTEPGASSVLLPLDGGDPVRLPVGFDAAVVIDGLAVGNTSRPATSPGAEPLILVDVTTGAVRDNLGPGRILAVGPGLVLFTLGCDVTTLAPCSLYRRSLADHATTSYRLPRPPGFTFGRLSADGRLLAFTLERDGLDPRYDQSHPIPPTEVAVLHLDTGDLHVVPGLELPPKSSPGLVFSPDGEWLVIGLNAGTSVRLLAWRAGMPHPYESTPVPGLVAGTPALVGLAPR